MNESGINEVLFFDDKESNVDHANKAGLNAYNVTGNDIEKIK